MKTSSYREIARQYQASPSQCLMHLEESLQKGYLKPEQFSIKQMFEEFVPDGREAVRLLDPKGSLGSSEAVALMEAVQSSAFKNISGQLIYTTIMQAYQNPLFVGDQLATTMPTQFNGEKIPGVTQLGDQAETVLEGEEYPDAGITEDWVETPETVKKGLKVTVTKETVFFDRTAQVLNRCRAVGDSLGINKEKRLIDHALGVTNTYKWKGTSYDTYQATTPWVNVKGGNALANWANLDAALQTFAALKDPNTGDPITVVPTQIIVHSSKVSTLNYILHATEVVVDPNAAAGTPQYQVWVPNNQLVRGTYQVLSGPWIDSRYTAGSIATTSWFFGDFKRAFAYMENWPIQVEEMPANAYITWARDVVAGWKASERGVAAVQDPRYTQRDDT